MADPATDPSMPEYKGGPLDAERGPGLGCFWIQIVLLVALLVLTPLSVYWAWPSMVSAALLIVTLLLLLFAGQTIIFLLRLVAADRRSRRRPLSEGASPTVGQLEDASASPGTASIDVQPEAAPPVRDDIREVATSKVAFFFGLAIVEGIASAFVYREFGPNAGLVFGLLFVVVVAFYQRRTLPNVSSFATLAWGVLALVSFFLIRMVA